MLTEMTAETLDWKSGLFGVLRHLQALVLLHVEI